MAVHPPRWRGREQVILAVLGYAMRRIVCLQGVGEKARRCTVVQRWGEGGEHLTRLPSRTHNTSDPR